MKVSETQKEIIKYLNNVIDGFGGAWVPVSLVDHVCKVGAALGLCVCGGMYDSGTNKQLLYIA